MLTPRRRDRRETGPLRAAAIAAASIAVAAGLGGCGGDEADTGSDATSGSGLTAPGTELEVRHPALVEFAGGQGQPARLQVMVTKVTKGKTSDLQGFALDKKARASTVYYVDASVQKVSGGNVAGKQITLYGKVSDSLVVQPVQFGSAFARCADRPLPSPFGTDDKARTCLVFLAPDDGSVSEIQWRGPGDEPPISWVVDKR